jgi:hypothetical protein
MDTVALVVIIVCAVAVVGAVALAVWMQRRRSLTLRQSFGPEYDRTVVDSGSKRKAEKDLEARRKRVEGLDIKPLSRQDADRYRARWKNVQAQFVDEPEPALDQADTLIAEVMELRGYPVGDFEHRAGDISVQYPEVVSHYRAGHDIAKRRSDGDKRVGTEDMRQAMVHYRALFDELVGSPRMTRRAS